MSHAGLQEPLMPYSPEVAEAARCEDAAWFAANAGATERVRASAQGEASVGPPPVGHRWVCTIVRELRPGIRVRRFVHAPEVDLTGGGAA